MIATSTTTLHRTLIALALGTAFASAEASSWAYRGTLEDGGQPANGRYDLRLSLLDANAAKSIGSAITFVDVQVNNGSFSVDADFGLDLTKFAALKLKTEVQQAGSGFVSIGEPSHFDAKAALAGICWDTTGNVVAASGEFLGSTNDVSVEIKSNNRRAAQFTAAGSVAAWGDAPLIALGSEANIASAFGATVGGGGATRDSSGTLDANQRNRASGNFAAISGGRGNTASAWDTVVAGGNFNVASGQESAVSGGRSNVASAPDSAVGGGAFNRASGSHGFVAGGNSNYASGAGSSALGGLNNTASGQLAVASGGSTCAGGESSFAAGTRAKVRLGTANTGEVGNGCFGVPVTDINGDNGTFVWADSEEADFTSTGHNQFLIRAQGGVGINTNTPTANALTVNGNVDMLASGSVGFGLVPRQMLNLYSNTFGIGVQTARMYFRVANTGGYNWFMGGTHNTGVDDAGGGSTLMRLTSAGQLLTTTGTIGSFSDARLKSDVGNYSGALDQIAALRPVHYRYTDAGKAPFQPEGTHLGFIAQEVQQVFPEWVSEDESGYLMLSMRGFEAVAVRGMQELQAENAALRTQADGLKSETAALRARLEAVEAWLGAASERAPVDAHAQ